MPPLEKVTAHLVIHNAFLALEKQERRTDFTPGEIDDWVHALSPQYAPSTIRAHLHSAMSTGTKARLLGRSIRSAGSFID